MVERVGRYIADHPRAFDAVVALFWTGLSFANDSAWDDPSDMAWLAPLTVAIGLPLYWRRRAPLPVWGIQAALVIGLVIGDTEKDVPIALLCGAYSLAAHCANRTWSIRAFVGFLAIGVAATAITDWRSLGDAAAIVLVLSIGWVVGDSLRTQRAYQRSVLERAERAEALRHSLAQQAVAEERTRIARELHDVVAHSMSLMVVQAGAARRLGTTNPEASAKALEAIETVGRNSLDEMRRILDVLRRDGEQADIAPQPDLGSLDELARELATAGLHVVIERCGDERPLPPSLELSAFRIVQEALTNSLKHAGARRATVELEYGATHLGITVRDDGRRSHVANDAVGSKRGHVGMRERVAAFGGSLTTGWRLDGGYEITAALPLEAEGDPVVEAEVDA